MQEDLTNIARHSAATAAIIRLQSTPDHLTLAVEDNGQGRPDQARASPRAFGLQGMRERATLLGGNVEMHSEPGRGTKVTVWLPLPSPAATTSRLPVAVGAEPS